MNITRSLICRHIYRPMSTSVIPSDAVSETATASAPTPRDDQLYKLLKVKCSSSDQEVLDSYEKFLLMTAEHLNLNFVGTEEPWRVIKRKTMLASRFVHKKYRVQYESRSYFKHVIFKNMTGSTLDTFLEYIQRNLPEGVLMEAEKHRLAELPFELTNDTSGEKTEAQQIQSEPNK